jgi:hypothetical protein
MNRNSRLDMMKQVPNVTHPSCPMARYTRSITVAAPEDDLQQLLADILQSCNFEVVHTTEGYLMARENPGKVSFTKLVIVEVLIDNTMATNTGIRLNFVIKSEELPLQADNHCRQMFDRLSQALENNKNWELVESITGA